MKKNLVVSALVVACIGTMYVPANVLAENTYSVLENNNIVSKRELENESELFECNESNPFSYTVDKEGKLIITNYCIDADNVVIPKKINGIDVYGISTLMFTLENIKSLEFHKEIHIDYVGPQYEYGVKILGVEGSEVIEFAKKYEMPYEVIDKEPEVYTIHFNLAGYNDITIEGNTYVLNVNNPTKQYYLFNGWKDNDGKVYYKGSTISLSNNITLTPVWKNYKYTVRFNSNGGVGTVNPLTMETNIKKNIPTNSLTKKGYKFVKWNTKADGTGTSYYVGSSLNNLTTINNGNVTLYAIYGKESKLSFNANTGSMKKTTLKVYRGIKIGKLPTPTKKGYTFIGWYTAKKGGSLVTENTLYNLNVNSTLYARYKINTYTIKYNLNGGTNTTNPTTYNVTSLFTLKKPTRVGYAFAGWYSNATLKTKITKIKKGSINNKVLYAKWTPITYSITYNANGGKGKMSKTSNVKYDSTTTLRKNTFTKKGCTFVGWSLNKNGTGTIFKDQNTVKNLTTKSKGNITLYAVWKMATYNINYVLDGGINNLSNPKTYTIETNTITLKKPTKEGYIFTGWHSSLTSTKNINQIKKGSTGTVTLYASWFKKTENITNMRQLVVETARKELGNKGGKKFWSWWGAKSRFPWCACFVSWVAEQTGNLESKVPKFIGVGVGYKYYNSRGQFHKRGTYIPQPGDIIWFDWEVNGRLDHVGFVDKVEGGYVYTIEGNSTNDTARAKKYPLNSKYIVGYGEPKYDE